MCLVLPRKEETTAQRIPKSFMLLKEHLAGLGKKLRNTWKKCAPLAAARAPAPLEA